MVSLAPALSASPSPAAPAVRALLARAEALIGQGDPVAAEHLLLPAPASARRHELLAVCALLQGRFEQALHEAGSAVALTPGDARCLFTLGRAHKAGGDLESATLAYRRAVEVDPAFVAAWISLGIALKARGDLTGAIACQRRATQLDPHSLPAHRNLGLALLRAGRHSEAAHAYNELLGRAPGDAEVCLLLGHCLRQVRGDVYAQAAFERWLRLNPPATAPATARASVMRALAGLLTDSGRADAALDWARQAHALAGDALSLQAVATALTQSRQLEAGLRAYREAIAMALGDATLLQGWLMALLYDEDDPAQIAAAHARYGALVQPAGLLRRAPPPRERGRPLRIGCLSGDLRRHSVAYFIANLLEHHDRRRIEIVCYHTQNPEDRVSARLRSFGPRWVEAGEMSDAELGRRIETDGIEVLLDLSGHTKGSRLALLATAPAPVQVAWLGYPTRTGVQAMDFRISDPVIDPMGEPAADADAGPEVVLRCASTMFCYRPDLESESGAGDGVEAPPALASAALRFGSFNNIAKLNDRTLALWARVLVAVPGSVLRLKSASLATRSNQADIAAFMQRHGVAPDRLGFEGWRPDPAAHLAGYREIDIALDTTPYNGATTTCEALWMGLQVVSLRGRSHPSRMGASILGAIGRSVWVAGTDDEFVRIAVGLAADPAGRAAWRREARRCLRASPLMDAGAHARDIERLLETAWRRRGGHWIGETRGEDRPEPGASPA